MVAKTRQVYRSTMGRFRFRAGLVLLLLILVACIVAAIYSLVVRYIPPAHEKNAQNGIPVVKESYLYESVASDFGYSFSLAANLYQREDGSVSVFLTNPIENDVSILCEIRDAETGQLYYKSGLLSPGEFVEKLKPGSKFANELHNVKVKILAYEPEKYLSAGTTELRLALQPW